MRSMTPTARMTAMLATVGMLLSVGTVAQAQDQNAEASVNASSSHHGSKDADGPSDHAQFASSFGVGYMGQRWVPIAATPTFADGRIISMDAKQGAVDAPVIGMRYWFSERLGLDVGVGFRTQGGSATYTRRERNPGDPNAEPVKYEFKEDDLSQTGVLIHAGVPVALNAQKHFVFELIPEMNLGFSTGTLKDQQDQPPSQSTAPVTMHDIKLSGLRLDIGARVGAELHFGFIGVPNLALQATVGAYFSMQKIKADGGGHGATNPNNPATQAPKATYEHSSTSFTTTSFDSPWAIFQNTVSAMYYF